MVCGCVAAHVVEAGKGWVVSGVLEGREIGKGEKGIYQFGLEYWLSLASARACSSGADAAKERVLKRAVAKIIQVATCIWLEYLRER